MPKYSIMLDSWNYVPIDSDTPDTYGDFDYSEGLGSGAISGSSGNPGVTRIFYVLWDSVPDFLDDLLGFATVTSDGLISRVLPDRHPVYSNLYALEYSVEPKGRLGQDAAQKLASYDVAMITTVYRSPTYAVLSDDQIETDGSELDRFVSKDKLSVGGEAMTINNKGLLFVSNVGADSHHLAMNQPPTRPTMSITFSYVWHWVPANPELPYTLPNWTGVTNCVGKVNVDYFDPHNYNFPPGTVLFMGAEPRMMNYRIAEGTDDRSNLYYEITFTFIYRNNGHINRSTTSGTLDEYAGHNFFYDMGKSQFDLVTTDGTLAGGRLILTADFDTLFKIG